MKHFKRIRSLLQAAMCLASIGSFSAYAEDWTYDGYDCHTSKIMSANGTAVCNIVKEVVGSALTKVWLRVQRYTLDNPASCFFFLSNASGSNMVYSITNLPNTTAPQSVSLNIPSQTGMNDGYAQVFCMLNQYDEIKSIRVQQLN